MAYITTSDPASLPQEKKRKKEEKKCKAVMVNSIFPNMRAFSLHQPQPPPWSKKDKIINKSILTCLVIKKIIL